MWPFFALPMTSYTPPSGVQLPCMVKTPCSTRCTKRQNVVMHQLGTEQTL